MSEKSIAYSKTVVVCDKCGRTSEREDYEGRPYFIHCHFCKRDFCFDCYGKHNNPITTLREIYSWHQTESFICDECYERLKTRAALQDGIARHIQAKENIKKGETELARAMEIIHASIE